MWLNNAKHSISSSKNGKTPFNSKGEFFMGRHVLAAEVVKQWEWFIQMPTTFEKRSREPAVFRLLQGQPPLQRQADDFDSVFY